MSATPDSQAAAALDDEQLGGGDPHVPENAADIVVDQLMAERGTNEKVDEEAEEAAREVEAEEEAE